MGKQKPPKVEENPVSEEAEMEQWIFWAELKARKDQATQQLELSTRKNAAARKLGENAKIRTERDAYYKKEADWKKEQIAKVDDEIENLKSMMDQRTADIELQRERHSQRLSQLEQHFTDIKNRMNSESDTMVETRTKSLNASQQLQAVESETTYLQNMLDHLKRSNENVKLLNSSLSTAIAQMQ